MSINGSLPSVGCEHPHTSVELIFIGFATDRLLIFARAADATPVHRLDAVAFVRVLMNVSG
jgi:hypothetical protein